MNIICPICLSVMRRRYYRLRTRRRRWVKIEYYHCPKCRHRTTRRLRRPRT